MYPHVPISLANGCTYCGVIDLFVPREQRCLAQTLLANPLLNLSIGVMELKISGLKF
jgi:hypothetical protein